MKLVIYAIYLQFKCCHILHVLFRQISICKMVKLTKNTFLQLSTWTQSTRTVWNSIRPLLRTKKCIDFCISRPLLRTQKYIDFGILQKCPLLRTQKCSDFGIPQKCPILRNLFTSLHFIINNLHSLPKMN